ncbi:MAG: ectoine hydroxylase [Myxococcota bacterium]
MTDVYPSRTGTEAPRPVARRDPVPWCSVAAPRSGPLTRTELASFAEDGFLVFENLFSDEEVASLMERVEALLARGADDDAPEIVRERGGDRIRSLFAVHRSDDLFAELARDRRIVSRVEQLLDSRAYIHQSRVNLKPAFDGREFDWHSDFETWHVEDGMPRMRAVSCSIALTGNEAHNGPLLLMPGSHHQFVACPGATPERHYETSLRRQEYGVPDRGSLTRLARKGIFAFTGRPGSFVLFECNVMHGSNGNITPTPRTNAFFVYNSVENRLEAPYSGQAPRPDYLASRDFTPLDEGDEK